MFKSAEKPELVHMYTHIINLKDKKRAIMILIAFTVLIAFISSIFFINYKKRNVYTGEIAKAMTYEKVKDGEEIIAGTDYITFDAFFLRDIDGDGYAEALRGTCKNIGGEDTLYMELNVLANGYLEGAVIEINSDNFYFETSLPRNSEIKENAIGSNIKIIKLNDISEPVKISLSGMVHSGDYNQESTKIVAIGNDTNKYSKINSITLKGTQVEKVIDSDGNETENRIPIEKNVNFNVDWYGTTKTEIPNRLNNKNNISQYQSLKSAIDEENNEFKTEYNIIIQEVNNELILKKGCIETEIPELNGYKPLRVEVVGNNISYTYDEENGKLIAQKEAVIDEQGIVISQAYDGKNHEARYNEFKVEVVYPLDAYKELGEINIYQELTVKASYEGYNNNSEEFKNPYKSTATESITLNIDNREVGDVLTAGSYIGKMLHNPTNRFVVSKENMLKVYNGISDTDIKNTYTVNWCAYTGENGNTSGLVFVELGMEQQKADIFIKKDNTIINMEDITSNIGIYFSDPSTMLGDDGWIKIFDNETDELLETFTNKNWGKYSNSNPYVYERPIKHIRIETSSTNTNECLSIYHIKNMDTEYVTKNISREEFDEIKQIETFVNVSAVVEGTNYSSFSWALAEYEAPYAKADMELSQSALSTQETKDNMEITIKAEGNVSDNQVKWLNGAFLLKLPKEILDLEINSVTSSDKVKITSYEYYEDNDGEKFIKVNTENEEPEIYNIVINCNITPDPRISTQKGSIILYSYNENASDYWKSDTDIYDVNDNLNFDEKVGITSRDINFVSPNSILTNETITDYDTKGSVTISPQVAILSKTQRTANINIEIKNNYISSVSDILILGRVPFENNKYVINGKDMGSNFSVKMETGISMSEALMAQGTVYYSENGEATKDLTDSNNGWTKTPEDFSKVKSYLIDLGDYVFEKDKITQFTYTIRVPEGLNYNQISYSHHAMYFSLNTTEGKYRTQIEPNKVGLMIGKEYNLEILKYQIGTDKLVAGATYSIVEDGEKEEKTKVTDLNGKLVLKNLYVDRTYIVKEIKSPLSYELNNDEIKFKTTEENGQLKVSLLSGNPKNIEILEPDGENGHRVQIQVEDEVKPSLKIIKTENGTNTPIKGVQFKITGEGLPNSGRGLITNNDGEVTLNGLRVGTEYTLEEIQATGYYLENPIKFVTENNDGNYSINIKEGNIACQTITEIDGIPTINLNIENTKIPTYNLQINKVVKGETTPIAGVKFRLYKGTKKIGDYETDTKGTIIINNLYQYEADRNIEQTYTLKETFAPDGFSVVNDITFRVEKNEDSLTMTVLDGKIKEQSVSGNTISVTIEDSPSFKLIKKDGETGEILPGTKFAIYNITDGTAQTAYDSKGNILGTKETIDGKDYYTLTTNEKGEITASLKEGLYKAIEVQTSSDKYELTNKEYFFGIGATRESANKKVLNLYKHISSTDKGDVPATMSKTADGGIIVGVVFENSIQLDNGKTIESNGDTDIIIIKYNKDGEIDWWKHYGGLSRDRINSLTATNDGGIIVGLTILNEKVTLEKLNGSIYTTKANSPTLLIKYDINGNILWNDEIEGNDYTYIQSICETSSKEIVIGVRFYQTITFSNGNKINAGSGYDNCIVKYNENGDFQWQKQQFNESGAPYIKAMVGTNDGGIIVGKTFNSSETIKDDVIITANKWDILVEKLNNDGEVVWYKQIGGSDDDELYDIIETNDGRIIVGGSFKNSITLDIGETNISETITSFGQGDSILLEYNSDGILKSYKHIGNTNNDGIRKLANSNDGGIYVDVFFEGTLTLENNEEIKSMNTDDIILKYNNNLEFKECEEHLTGYGYQKLCSIEELDDGELLLGVQPSNEIVVYNESNLKETKYVNRYEFVILKSFYKEVPNIVTKKVDTVGGIDEDLIETIIETSDGGMVVAVRLKDNITLEDKKTTISKLLIIKYNVGREIEWIDEISSLKEDYYNDNDSHIYAICETKESKEIVIGISQVNKLIFSDGEIFDGNKNRCTCLIKYNKDRRESLV